MQKMLCVLVAACLCPSPAFAEENPKVGQALEKLDAALATEAQRLKKMNKKVEADHVLAIQKAVQDQIKPLSEPGKCSELRKQMFFDELGFEWTRPTNPDRFVFFKVPTPQGVVMKTKVVQPTGAIPVEGVLSLTGEDSAEIRWTNGVTWKVYAAGKRRLLVDEYNGAVQSNDGIMLYR